MISALDEAVMNVTLALRRVNKYRDTVMVFMSDNGAFRLSRRGLDVGINDPLRSGGVTCWEGGLRVAALARWPGKIKSGSVINEPFWSPDLLTACAELAGATLPDDRVFDGRNPLPLLTANAESPHKSLFFVYRTHAALRKGDWKIVRERPGEAWQLFNLKNDLSESMDLAALNPDRRAELVAEFATWQKVLRQEK